jgi:hypothetical protein
MHFLLLFVAGGTKPFKARQTLDYPTSLFAAEPGWSVGYDSSRFLKAP